MRLWKLGEALLALSCLGSTQELAPEVLLVARIKANVREELSRLPDYACLETIARFRKPAQRGSKMMSLDTVRLEVLYSGNREWYGSPGDRSLHEPNPTQLIGRGMIANGPFALFLRMIFLGHEATFKHQGEEFLGGRKTAKFDFHLPALLSGQSIAVAGGTGIVGLKGSFWADPISLDLMRLEARADEIPPSLPVQEMTARVEYTRTRIGASDTLLPQDADLYLLETSGEESYSRLAFTHCRQFQTESAIRFDTDSRDVFTAPAPGHSGVVTGPTKPATKLPAQLSIPVELMTPINENNAVGTSVYARSYGDVRRKGKTIVPDGSTLQGRIRRLQRFDRVSACFVLELEFTEIEIRGMRMPFYADLQKIDRSSGIQQASANLLSQTFFPRGSGNKEVEIPEPPGVASLFIPGNTVSLQGGLRMVWRTREF